MPDPTPIEQQDYVYRVEATSGNRVLKQGSLKLYELAITSQIVGSICAYGDRLGDKEFLDYLTKNLERGDKGQRENAEALEGVLNQAAAVFSGAFPKGTRVKITIKRPKK